MDTYYTGNPMDVSVFFNPDCDNCRTVKGILDEQGIDASYVRYLDQAPSRSDLETVLRLLGTDDPRLIVRTKEPVYDQLNLQSAGRDELIDAMSAHPILIQRPIVIRGDKAVIARPAELVVTLFDEESGADQPTASSSQAPSDPTD
jgi:arsenate reductase (glutaredoxin)